MLGCCFKKQFSIYFDFPQISSIINTKQKKKKKNPGVDVTGNRSKVDAVKSNIA